MWNAGLDEAQAGIKIAGININNIFLGCKITADGNCSHEIERHLHFGRKAMTNLDSIFKSRDITLPTKVHLVKAMVFPVVMCGCESWTIEKAEHWSIDCFWTVMLEKTLESPLDCMEIKPISPKGNQSWIFIGRSDVEAEALILWPSDAKIQIIGKDTDAGQDWRQGKGMTEDKMVGWHHQFNRCESEQAPGDGEGQGSLGCCSPWGRKESDTTEQLNNNNNKDIIKTSLWSCAVKLTWNGTRSPPCLEAPLHLFKAGDPMLLKVWKRAVSWAAVRREMGRIQWSSRLRSIKEKEVLSLAGPEELLGIEAFLNFFPHHLL